MHFLHCGRVRSQLIRLVLHFGQSLYLVRSCQSQMGIHYTLKYLSLHLCYQEGLWTSELTKIVVACASIKPIDAGLVAKISRSQKCQKTLCGKYELECDQSASRKSRHNVVCSKVGSMTFDDIVPRRREVFVLSQSQWTINGTWTDRYDDIRCVSTAIVRRDFD